MNTITYVDASCVTMATLIAGCGALGFSPDWFPMETVGIAADLGAGSCAARHAAHHFLHKRKHKPEQPKPTISIAHDGRGRVTWSR